MRADLVNYARLMIDDEWPATIAVFATLGVKRMLEYQGRDYADLYRRTASYVDRIFKGAKPAELPVEQPTRFDFVVNLKTAQALGITFPNEIMLQVTEVIQ